MYLHVDVPMPRLPAANWTLIVVTSISSLFLLAAEHKAGYRSDLTDFPTDPAVERQLDDPWIPEAKKQQLRQQEVQRLEAWLAANLGKVPDDSPLLKFALHTDWASFHVWQLITYQFVHGDFWHLLGNMLFLFCFGNAVNAKLGHGLYVLLYLALGVFAGLAFLVTREAAPLIGASGAISGITGVFLVLYPINEISVWTIRSLIYSGDAWRFPAWLFILFYMVWDFIGTLKLTGESGVAYVCHLGGELVGIGVAFGLILAGWIQSERGEQNLAELWGWVKNEKPRKPRKPRPKLPPPASEDE